MKNIAFLFLLIFANCKQDEMSIVSPEYSFVRINEDNATIPGCSVGTVSCLPIVDLSDLIFQFVTDFQADPGEGMSRLVALPCQSCGDYSDEEILEMAFGIESKLSNGNGNNSGNLYISFASLWDSLAVGDYINLENACTAGCAFNYDGIYQVLDIIEFMGTSIVVLDTPFEGLIENPESVLMTHLSSAPYLLGSSSFAIPDDSEFEGDNYAWDLSKPVNASSEINYADLQCFSLCVYRATQFGELTDVECLGMSNCFQKVSNTCYTSKIRYGCNENAFGFYTDGTNPFSVSIRIALYLHSPKLPGEEKGYQKSDGSFVKLSERINKTWQLESDYMPIEIHERIRVALSCDNISITNENVNLVDAAIYRSDPYELGDNSEDVQHKFPFFKGTTIVFKKLLEKSLNSNCA